MHIDCLSLVSRRLALNHHAISDKEKLLKAIDLGINKYFIKPFDPDELINYINKIVPKLQKEKEVLLKEDFIFDNNSLSLYRNNTLIELTKREKEFFHLMIKNKNNLVLSQTLKDKLWEEDISDEVLRTFIKRVRLKTSKELIENISGQGYLISVLNN
jgi:DNA-binding response OmpR family regulator